MGKFDGILLCTDLDGTLLNSKCEVSKENIAAIKYFMENGGKFTFATGRVPHGAEVVTDFIMPNAPAVVIGGAGIYDFNAKSLLWGLDLYDDVREVIRYTEEIMPDMGYIVCTDKKVHFCEMNDLVNRYMIIENLPLDTTPYDEIPTPWKKIVFVEQAEKISRLEEMMQNAPFFDNYDFVKSCAIYYECLPKNATKGTAVLKLSEMLGIKQERIIAVGDNENDVSMIEAAGLGIAVKNSEGTIADKADIITVSNENHAIAKIIWDLDCGKILM